MKKLITLVMFFGCGVAQAVPVTYIVEGVINLGGGSSVDRFDIDGAKFQFRVTGDTEQSYTRFLPNSNQTEYTLYSEITIYDRPTGYSDIVSSFMNGGDSGINNLPNADSYSCISGYDCFALAAGQIIELNDVNTVLNFVAPALGFDQSFFTTNPTPLPGAFTAADVLALRTSYFDGTYMGTYVYYDSTITNVYASVVPIPAAAWLFGSGLGLLGWIKRRSLPAISSSCSQLYKFPLRVDSKAVRTASFTYQRKHRDNYEGYI